MDIKFLDFKVEKWELFDNSFKDLSISGVIHSPYLDHRVTKITNTYFAKFELKFISVLKLKLDRKIILNFESVSNYAVDLTDLDNVDKLLRMVLQSSYDRHIKELSNQSQGKFKINLGTDLEIDPLLPDINFSFQRSRQ